MGLWNDIKGWLDRPFSEPGNMMDWLLLVVVTATIVFAWSRVLEKVLEE
jgi:hypothetical protein